MVGRQQPGQELARHELSHLEGVGQVPASRRADEGERQPGDVLGRRRRLDPVAEADVFRRFAAMAHGRTAVLVSHRLGFARLCDRVLVLRGGELIELGTHDDLVAAGGEYARMWATQAQWYR